MSIVYAIYNGITYGFNSTILITNNTSIQIVTNAFTYNPLWSYFLEDINNPTTVNYNVTTNSYINTVLGSNAVTINGGLLSMTFPITFSKIYSTNSSLFTISSHVNSHGSTVTQRELQCYFIAVFQSSTLTIITSPLYSGLLQPISVSIDTPTLSTDQFSLKSIHSSTIQSPTIQGNNTTTLTTTIIDSVSETDSITIIDSINNASVTAVSCPITFISYPVIVLSNTATTATSYEIIVQLPITTSNTQTFTIIDTNTANTFITSCTSVTGNGTNTLTFTIIINNYYSASTFAIQSTTPFSNAISQLFSLSFVFIITGSITSATDNLYTYSENSITIQLSSIPPSGLPITLQDNGNALQCQSLITDGITAIFTFLITSSISYTTVNLQCIITNFSTATLSQITFQTFPVNNYPMNLSVNSILTGVATTVTIYLQYIPISGETLSIIDTDISTTITTTVPAITDGINSQFDCTIISPLPFSSSTIAVLNSNGAVGISQLTSLTAQYNATVQSVASPLYFSVQNMITILLSYIPLQNQLLTLYDGQNEGISSSTVTTDGSSSTYSFLFTYIQPPVNIGNKKNKPISTNLQVQNITTGFASTIIEQTFNFFHIDSIVASFTLIPASLFVSTSIPVTFQLSYIPIANDNLYILDPNTGYVTNTTDIISDGISNRFSTTIESIQAYSGGVVISSDNINIALFSNTIPLTFLYTASLQTTTPIPAFTQTTITILLSYTPQIPDTYTIIDLGTPSNIVCQSISQTNNTLSSILEFTITASTIFSSNFAIQSTVAGNSQPFSIQFVNPYFTNAYLLPSNQYIVAGTESSISYYVSPITSITDSVTITDTKFPSFLQQHGIATIVLQNDGQNGAIITFPIYSIVSYVTNTLQITDVTTGRVSNVPTSNTVFFNPVPITIQIGSPLSVQFGQTTTITLITTNNAIFSSGIYYFVYDLQHPSTISSSTIQGTNTNTITITFSSNTAYNASLIICNYLPQLQGTFTQYTTGFYYEFTKQTIQYKANITGGNNPTITKAMRYAQYIENKSNRSSKYHF